MKNIFIVTLITFFSILITFANETEYILNKNQKLIGTYSGDIDQKSSIHLIIVKNKTNKNHEIIPFYVDDNFASNKLSKLSFKKVPTILSYHLNGDILTLLVTHEIKRKTALDIIDLNLKTNETSKNQILDFDKIHNTVFRLIDKTILLEQKDRELFLSEIINSNKIKKSNTKIDIKDKLDYFFKDDLDVININEFVKNGSIKKSKAYIENNTIFIERINQSINKIDIMSFDINSISNHVFHSFDVDKNLKVKDINTFINDGNLFSSIVHKDDASIKITNIKSGETLLKKSLKTELINYIDNEQIANFIKNSSKKRYKPTITVNKTEDNNMLLNIDYVNTATYSYYHDWWFQHWMMQQMMWQQQQIHIQHSIPTFGPRPIIDYYYKVEKKAMQLVLNSDFEILENVSKETIRKDVDKDKYLDLLKDDKQIKFPTASFLNNSYRTIYYVKKSKKVIIKNEKLTEFSIK